MKERPSGLPVVRHDFVHMGERDVTPDDVILLLPPLPAWRTHPPRGRGEEKFEARTSALPLLSIHILSRFVEGPRTKFEVPKTSFEL